MEPQVEALLGGGAGITQCETSPSSSPSPEGCRRQQNQARQRLGLAAIVNGHGRAADVAVVVDTREQVGELNAAIRGQLVADGRVDDTRVVTTRAGQRIGAGDRIATRRNDRDLDVANRDTWTVTAVGRRGELLVTAGTAAGDIPRGGVTPADPAVRVLPADYVAEHVELAYASTVHGVQGDT
jgi:ATP-dependent exoDNAse (exonuclease V) alpha subunit